MRVIFLLFVFLSTTADSFCQENWTLAKDNDGVQVFVRPHPGTRIKEFKAITTFSNVSLDYFYRLFKNAERASDWSYGVARAKILSSPKANEDIVYYEIDAPWPLKQRDVVQKQILTFKDSVEFVCFSYSLPDYLPKNKAFVRVVESQVKWVFHAKNSKDVEVTYEFFTDPKVPIPQSIVDFLIVNAPIYMFEKMRSFVAAN